ncbi:MAG: hypothetical protein ACTSUK_00050 [Promethearchaeota archaeon]
MEQIYSNYSTEISSHKLSNSSQIHIHKFHDDYNSGYRVCTECGFVAQDLLFSQYTPYNEQNKDQFLQKIPSSSKNSISSNLNRAFKLEKKVPWSQKKISLGKNELKRLISQFSLPKLILDRSFYLFQKICRESCFKTHYIRLMSQVCLYYAVKERGFPIIMEDIVDRTRYRLSLAQQYYYLLIRTLNLPNTSGNALGFISRYGTHLHLDESLIQKTIQLVHKLQSKKNLSGYDNRGIAAGALYFVCNMHRIRLSQKLLAKITGISEITIRSRYKEICVFYKKYMNRI